MIDIEKNPLLREAVRAACEILSELTKQGAFSNDDAYMLISICQKLNTKQIQTPMQRAVCYGQHFRDTGC